MASKPSIQFMHLCEHATVDVAQRLSVIDIFQSFNFRQLPSVYPKFVVVASIALEKDDREHEIRFSLLQPDGTEMGNVPYRIRADKTGNSVFMAHFTTREFRMPDEHRVEVLVDGQKIGALPFMVNLIGSR